MASIKSADWIIGNYNALFLLISSTSPISLNSSIMQVVAILLVCLAAANAFYLPATTLVRTPAHDSAIIRSDRLGGNFAYSTVEGHAYAAITPVVQRVLTPVGVSHHAVAAPYYAGYPAYTGYPFAAPVAVEAPKTVTVEGKSSPLVYVA